MIKKDVSCWNRCLNQNRRCSKAVTLFWYDHFRCFNRNGSFCFCCQPAPAEDFSRRDIPALGGFCPCRCMCFCIDCSQTPGWQRRSSFGQHPAFPVKKKNRPAFCRKWGGWHCYQVFGMRGLRFSMCIFKRKRNIEYGGPANSWELASIIQHQYQLNQFENIVKCYIKIGIMRELQKTKLNYDVNDIITSFVI